jgi:hypothetical protein
MKLPPLFVCLAAASAYGDAPRAVAKGSFLLFTQAPSSHSLVRTFGSYDTAQRTAALASGVQVKLSDTFQLQADLSVDDGGPDPSANVQVGLLDEDVQPIDLQLSAGWTLEGFNLVPAVFAVLSVGKTVGTNYLTSSATFELGTEQGEGAAVVAAGVVHTVTHHVYVALDSQVQLDLERDRMEPADEQDWDLALGPIATYATGNIEISAAAGFTATQPHEQGVDVGVYAGIGFGTAR